MGNVIENENVSHLSETDKLEKRTFMLSGNELEPEPSPTSVPPPLPAARSETNCVSPRNTDSSPEESLKVHALLDEGSTATLIDEQVANGIGANGRHETLHVSSVGGNEITDEQFRVIRVKIKELST
ncbi:hypothetical protein EVAR_99550_1 [Eumeta japonica]|uniref:Uncharacterized protein n=1 Tax=Eumeta variegata TaxID=151549 RepID=A0A4C1YY41_EUMVA|nr:hypothetical protein EVAR_99550_1 [Eumeta japonica]